MIGTEAGLPKEIWEVTDMPCYRLVFLQGHETLGRRTFTAVDDLAARDTAFSEIRAYVSKDIIYRGQIDLRACALLERGDGFQLFRIEFSDAVGVVR